MEQTWLLCLPHSEHTGTEYLKSLAAYGIPKPGAVVVAQLVEQSLPTPEIRGSNPNIGKLYLPIVH